MLEILRLGLTVQGTSQTYMQEAKDSELRDFGENS